MIKYVNIDHYNSSHNRKGADIKISVKLVKCREKGDTCKSSCEGKFQQQLYICKREIVGTGVIGYWENILVFFTCELFV